MPLTRDELVSNIETNEADDIDEVGYFLLFANHVNNNKLHVTRETLCSALASP